MLTNVLPVSRDFSCSTTPNQSGDANQSPSVPAAVTKEATADAGAPAPRLPACRAICFWGRRWKSGCFRLPTPPDIRPPTRGEPAAVFPKLGAEHPPGRTLPSSTLGCQAGCLQQCLQTKSGLMAKCVGNTGSKRCLGSQRNYFGIPSCSLKDSVSGIKTLIQSTLRSSPRLEQETMLEMRASGKLFRSLSTGLIKSRLLFQSCCG